MNRDLLKTGYVAIIGRPNVGKSTLLNHLIGEKLSITSPKPQTTRTQLLGIKTTDDAQIIYIDTPGLHKDQKNAVNRYMNRVANAVMADADVIVWMIDALNFRKEDEDALYRLKLSDPNNEIPLILVINKIDLLSDKTVLLALIDRFKDMHAFSAIIPVSAVKKDNLEQLEKKIIELLPEGEPLYLEDEITDKSARFLVAEIIREKIIRSTQEELPYATTVTLEQWEEKENIVHINAIIWVERPGQKGIVIGKGGLLLKKIGTDARRDIEKLLDKKVFLRVWVKIKENWTDDEKALKNLGFE